MSVRRSAGVIFWGLTLVTVGGLLLANNLGYPIQIWPYVARYWPALLIAWGLLKFVDYYRFSHAGDTRPLFSGGEVRVTFAHLPPPAVEVEVAHASVEHVIQPGVVGLPLLPAGVHGCDRAVRDQLLHRCPRGGVDSLRTQEGHVHTLLRLRVLGR